MDREPNRYCTDVYIYTYYYSWKCWVANILRCLYFWNAPFGKEADDGIMKYVNRYAPKCPALETWYDWFKH